MVVTVSMNPAMDKTMEIAAFRPGGLNRVTKVEYDAGGKGVNVSKTIQKLGGESVAVGFLGGNAGKAIEKALDAQNIRHDFVWIDAETRTNTKVLEENGDVTELNEPGPRIAQAQIQKLLDKLSGYADPDTLFVLSGSAPNGVCHNMYADIIRLVHRRGAKALLDADGELFRQALAAGPDMIKPNRAELETYAGLEDCASEEELLGAARKLVRQGIQNVVVSLGKSGAIFLWEGYEVRCPALVVKAHSTVGAGDAMAAALAYAWERRLEREATVRLCMAASAGAVTTVGTKPPEREWIDALQKRVIIEKISSEYRETVCGG